MTAAYSTGGRDIPGREEDENGLEKLLGEG
jgi:hypothetical protein